MSIDGCNRGEHTSAVQFYAIAFLKLLLQVLIQQCSLHPNS
ncbi:MAG: hypothetical protein ACYT04_25705 [Nostoc sp.]